jgi:putative ABC transport system permease protein
VAVASPILEIDASIPGHHSALKIIANDALRAGFLTPDLIGVAADGGMTETLADDTIFLSPAAEMWLKTAAGQPLTLQLGMQQFALRVAGSLPQARAGQRIAVMDIGAAWRFNQPSCRAST